MIEVFVGNGITIIPKVETARDILVECYSTVGRESDIGQLGAASPGLIVERS